MAVLCPLSIFHSIYPVCALGGGRWCAPPIVMDVVMVDNSIYEGLSLVGNLRTIALLGIGIIIRYVGLMT